MRPLLRLAAIAALALSACQNSVTALPTVVGDGRIISRADASRIPAVLLELAGLEVGPQDRVINNGLAIEIDAPIAPGEVVHLEVIRSVPILINGKAVLTAALTVGEAVREQGFAMYAGDILDPPAETALSAGLIIAFQPAAAIEASADGTARLVRSATEPIGAVLADAGIPVEGLDLAAVSIAQAETQDSRALITRVTESLDLEQEAIPYAAQTTDSLELELGLERVVQPGIPGLAVTSTRVRRHDGVEVSRRVAPRSVVLEAQDRVLLRGTKLVEKTETIDGISITYWRNLQMYATTYSPCNSGTADGSCSTGTASGLPAGKGVVAVDPSLFAYLNGQRLYIPGYGFAVIGDIGGGYIVEQNLGISRYKWIDLGFDDNNIQDMTGWLSVYFLAPAPPSIPDVLR